MEANRDDIRYALIVHVSFRDGEGDDEFAELVKSAGLEIVGSIFASRTVVDANLFVGKGKAAEIASQATSSNADVIIFNQILSPAQERNLERYIRVRVVDRVGLILDIFAQRALSYEGKLQVELAQLQHLSSRLIHGWTHLERQKGGIGLRGPGETQLEMDRRSIGQRIKYINQRLQRVRKLRHHNRLHRKKNNVPIISLVGYTNAGKSTLFNRLTGANIKVADQLFATLDPTLRRLRTSSGRNVILADTVGFIRDLPHDLINAFQATLEEICKADLLLHVIDVDREKRQERIEEVNQVIDLLGAADIPQIEIYNKIDKHPDYHERTEYPGSRAGTRIRLSAITGAGIEELMSCIEGQINRNLKRHSFTLPVTAGSVRARLFEMGIVRQENINAEGGWNMVVELEDFQFNKLCKETELSISGLQSYPGRY